MTAQSALTALAALLVTTTATYAACGASASGLVFGQYNPFSTTPTNISGTITLSCGAATGAGNYAIALSAGSSGSYSQRQMYSNQTILLYQLYTDAARSQIWGDGTGESSAVVGKDNVPLLGGTSIYTVYGQIFAKQLVTPGAYTDTIIVTITY